MKSKQILREVNNDAHLLFVGLFCFVHVVQLSSRDGKNGNILYRNKNKSKDSPLNTWICNLKLYGKISAVTWPWLNYSATIMLLPSCTHSQHVINVPEVWRKSVSSNVCCGTTSESTGLSVLKTEQLRGRMKSSMDKVTPWAGVLLPAAMLEPWDAACTACWTNLPQCMEA